jgi:hypothetical protein
MELPCGTEQSGHPHGRHCGVLLSHVCVHLDWGSIDAHKFNAGQLASMKKTCQWHCFSTLNHNLAYCYNHARVMKFAWTNLVKNRMNGGARSFED